MFPALPCRLGSGTIAALDRSCVHVSLGSFQRPSSDTYRGRFPRLFGEFPPLAWIRVLVSGADLQVLELHCPLLPLNNSYSVGHQHTDFRFAYRGAWGFESE